MRAIRDHDHNVQRCSDKKFAGHKNKEKCATRKHERAVRKDERAVRKGKRAARNAGRGENKCAFVTPYPGALPQTRPVEHRPCHVVDPRELRLSRYRQCKMDHLA